MNYELGITNWKMDTRERGHDREYRGVVILSLRRISGQSGAGRMRSFASSG